MRHSTWQAAVSLSQISLVV